MRTLPKVYLAAILVLTGAQLTNAADEDKTPITQRKGLDNYNSGNTRRLVIVKASADTVIDALMKGNPTKQIVKDLKKKDITLKSRSYLVVQIKGQEWTAVLNLTKDAVEGRKLAAGLAAFLKTKAVFYSYSSFSDWTRYALFDGAKEVESLEGLDADSAKDMLSLGGGDPESRKILEAIRDNKGPLLKSTVRKFNPGEKDDADKFVDRALKAEGAFLPDMAGAFEGDAGQKFEMDELPAEEKDIAGIALVMGDSAPAK